MANLIAPASPRRRQDTEQTLNQSFSDMFFGFPDDESVQHGVSVSPNTNIHSLYEYSSDSDHCNIVEEEEKDHSSFWENQNQILQGTLRRTSCLETGIRRSVKQAIEELSVCECLCGRQLLKGCDICKNFCVMRQVSTRLRNEGYNSALCKSKWRTSPDTPSGEHTFLDVVHNSSSKKGEAVRVIIELNFRAEFEMARASDEYNKLVRRLPEVFVGKAERLHSLIKIMCSAAKKCMKERKMHMGPWRKQRYMQAKWLGVHERVASPVGPTPLVEGPAGGAASGAKAPRAKAASMLTVDLLDYAMPNGNMLCKTVTVV